MQKLQGFAQAGDQQVTTAGQVSTTVVQGSFPLCTVTVYLQGTMTLASIFSNNTSTAKSNPFTADANGNWFFLCSQRTIRRCFFRYGNYVSVHPLRLPAF